MKTTKALFAGATTAASALLWTAWTRGAPPAPGGTTIDGDDIAGVVTGARGPEAGVWVIAETSDLPTKFTRIVVTDDRGRYLLPDLPSATYTVWVRGYGLVDSPKRRAGPGTTLNLRATPAPSTWSRPRPWILARTGASTPGSMAAGCTRCRRRPTGRCGGRRSASPAR